MKKFVLQNKLFVFVISLSLVFRLVYAVFIPQAQNPDEEHFFERSYSEVFGNLSKDKMKYVNNEYFYPPLYFSITASILSFFIHARDVNDFGKIFEASHILFKSIAIVLGVLQTCLIFYILNKLKFEKSILFGTFSLFSLMPAYLAFSNYLNPNSLLLTFMLLFLAILVSDVLRKIPFLKSGLLGFVAGLSMLIKFEGVGLLVIPIVFYYNKRFFKKYIFNMAVFTLFAFLVGSYWYIRNLISFSWFYDRDLFSASVSENLKPYLLESYGVSKIDYTWHLLLNTLHTMILVYGKTNQIRIDNFGYNLLLVPVIFFLFWSKKKLLFSYLKINKLIYKFYISLGVFFIFNIIVFLYLNFMVSYQPQGRYLFPSLLFIVISVCLFIHFSLEKKYQYLAPLSIIGLLAFLNFWGMGCMSEYFNHVLILPSLMKCSLF